MPILDERAFEFYSHSPEQTRRVGIRLGGLLKPGDVVCLEGNLGAGKTTLVQGIAQGWGSLDAVSSPTYVIVNEYRRPENEQLFHADAYRLSNSLDAEILDFDRMLQFGALVLEWPERIKEILPESNLWIQMKWTGAEQRYFLFKSSGKQYDKMVQKLKHSMFGGI
ncbi:MAG: tRNA (adenosine(37)-N6)-threonylcarbamoyltransferase complex ATPase subunit type 1 TsaE [Anaerolineaceae bacterium]|nr:tRNA (adenosine(37)-N6)-threonylcarbamoyltransferase complex ATPase subunit type 1 TsaE [Anaerolineaceae bacterium]